MRLSVSIQAVSPVPGTVAWQGACHRGGSQERWASIGLKAVGCLAAAEDNNYNKVDGRLLTESQTHCAWTARSRRRWSHPGFGCP